MVSDLDLEVQKRDMQGVEKKKKVLSFPLSQLEEVAKNGPEREVVREKEGLKSMGPSGPHMVKTCDN